MKSNSQAAALDIHRIVGFSFSRASATLKRNGRTSTRINLFNERTRSVCPWSGKSSASLVSQPSARIGSNEISLTLRESQSPNGSFHLSLSLSLYRFRVPCRRTTMLHGASLPTARNLSNVISGSLDYVVSGLEVTQKRKRLSRRFRLVGHIQGMQ